MESQLSKHFRETRLDKGIRVSHLARLCGYTNLSRGSRRIHNFESGGSIHRPLLMKMADALGIDRSKVEALVEEDRHQFFEEWSKWANEPIYPYLVVRMMAAVYCQHRLPPEIESVEEAEAFAADFTKTHRLKSCLVLSRKISVWFAEDGSVSSVTEAVPGQANSPAMWIGGRDCTTKAVEHGLALQQISWPKKQEIQQTKHEVVTDFGGVRMKSNFEIVEDEPGQVTVNIEGPLFEFAEQLAWETTLDDVRTVLAAHDFALDADQVEELFAGLDCGAVEKAVLHYTDFDDQIRAMFREIEDYLIERDIINGAKKFL